jgi:hypothetical protein
MKRYKHGMRRDEWGMEMGWGIIEDPNGYVVKYEDAKALYDALMMVLDDPDALDGRPRTYAFVMAVLKKARGES